jgi:hypothetical protein
MARCETNATTTICNISKGHGHPSSPSHPPLAWGEWGVRVTTHAEKTHAEKERTPRTLQVREPVARHGQANESRASTAIHSVGAWQHADRPSCQGMTAPLHRAHPSVTPRHHLVASPRGLCVFVPPSNVHQSQDSLILRLIRI